MSAETCWALFRATGAPEYYLLYRALLETPEKAEKSA